MHEQVHSHQQTVRQMNEHRSGIEFPRTARAIGLACAMLLAAVTCTDLHAQEAAEYFQQNCMSCHTIGGGRLTGPDLKDVGARRERAWLIDFIMDPKAAIDRGDPAALEMVAEARGVIMPTLPTMTRSRAEALLDLIAAESELEQSQFKGIQISERPFTAEDVARGRRLFLGEERLAGGAAPCMSCHAVQGIGGLGGGTLAPDLTTVYERYGDRRTLATWLAAPATATMQAVFKQRPLTSEETLALVAWFEHTLKRNPADPSTARLNFLLLGLGGTVLLLGLFDVIWNRRFRSVRRALLTQERKRA